MRTRHLSACVFSVGFSFLGLVAEAAEPEVTAISTETAAEAVEAVVAVPNAVVLTSAVSVAEVEPWINSRMPRKARAKLEAAFDLALQRVREVPECGDLFRELGADGVEMLETALYFPIGSPTKEVEMCGTADAFTYVGDAPTFLCRKFYRLSDERAAMVVVHEALHHAGLTEWPSDPDGMKSIAINRMVSESCGF